MAKRLLLNADVGEGMPGDSEVILHVDMANIAAGGHAGGGELLHETISLAVKHNTQIGAHPSYPDIENFGRVSLWESFNREALRTSLVEQILTVVGAAQYANAHVSYVKPHGALYNDAAKSVEVALFLGESIREASRFITLPDMPALPIMMLANSLGSQALAKAGFVVLEEGFADRAYTPSGALLDRTHSGAVLHDVKDICEQVERMWFSKQIVSADGSVVSVDIDTVCVHGDTPEAVEIAKALSKQISSWENAI